MVTKNQLTGTGSPEGKPHPYAFRRNGVITPLEPVLMIYVDTTRANRPQRTPLDIN